MFPFGPIVSCPVTKHHLAPSFLHPSFMYFYTLTISSCAFCSSGWIVPALSTFLTGEILQARHHLSGSSLDSQHVHVTLVLGVPELVPVIQVWSHQCWIKGNDHLTQPSGNTLTNADQDTFSFLSKNGLKLRLLLYLVWTAQIFCKLSFSKWAQYQSSTWKGGVIEGRNEIKKYYIFIRKQKRGKNGKARWLIGRSFYSVFTLLQRWLLFLDPFLRQLWDL